ncbi:putative CocE/NonD family hydrolase [Kibdelosporangium banguiense]|uniref:CocE/NonD family hydrolase n=1 Tax=Kibdelosporangium banguiense TaxID=1365924 RepID=A0ABS4TS18_9PSEU|nr:CocE/NonD family hydrolase [Kibdelosporangium banguiense]MBP2327210.1 putative CocE/NonD family hydrolase [Kibdelosporangium banguiense]
MPHDNVEVLVSFEIIETMTSETASRHATEYMVATRDGAELATDVYLPGNATTHSAILVRTPYDKSSRYTALKHEAEYFRQRGFAFVAQDVRGKFRSSGETVPYEFDVADAYDTAEWIARQPWSNGRIGVSGASYYGFTTWAAVASGHPAIKAAIPQVTGIEMGGTHVASRWRHEVPPFLALNDLLQIWTNNEGYLAEIDWASDRVANIIAQWHEQVGECAGATRLLDMASRQDWYNPYGARHPYHTTNIPILHWQNWYDPGLAPSGFRDWRYFRSQPSQRNLHYLRVGSADHSGYKLEDVGAGDKRNPYVSEQALAEKIETECGEMADFFDEHLNGVPLGQARPRARWHVGHVGWQSSADYPPPSRPLTFHLATTGEHIHGLSLETKDSATTVEWTHDPKDPVPSTTHIEAVWFILAAYPDERALAERSDVLTFRTEPLAENLDFAGQPVLTGQISFSSPSTHVFAKLQDVCPDGTTRPISWGRVVMSESTGTDLHLAMDDNAYRVQQGHRLQLQIQSSDFPHFAIHPGTDESPWLATTRIPSRQGIEIGGPRGAQLTLPVITIAES